MPRDIDPFVRDLVRRKARQIIGRAGLKPQDRGDVEQELLLQAIRRLSSRDPQQAQAQAFIVTVMERVVASYLRDRQAQRRSCHVSSLALATPTADGPTEQDALLGRPQQDARLGIHRRGDEDQVQLASDVADVLAGLPDELHALAERLKTQSIAEVARDLSLPRTTLYQAVRQLRMRFERAGLKDYLEQSSSCRAPTG